MGGATKAEFRVVLSSKHCGWGKMRETGGELSVAVKTLKVYMQVSHDANIVVFGG